MPIPFLRRKGAATQLVVDGRPFLALGGELHNSSSSDPAYFRSEFAQLADAGMSTIIATVSWEQVEPTEGHFDFTVLAELLAAARDNSLRLVLIWFGAFKNATSTYAPSWVRADRQRFPRATVRPGSRTAFSYEGATPKPVLSVFSAELREADRTAYVAMLEYLRDHDSDHTVILIQVENESGLLGDSRDRSPLAEGVWTDVLPPELRSRLAIDVDWVPAEIRSRLTARSNFDGSWAEVFGDDELADEVFMSWAFGGYLDTLAAAGKAVLPLPVYANAWLGPQPGQDLPGQFPSGGPTARMRPVWQLAAPSIDFLAPDIYVDAVADALAAYAADDNPLFVPEAKIRAGDMLLAVGKHRAIGFCAFGIDEIRPGSQYGEALGFLLAASQLITTAQAEDRIIACVLDPGTADVEAEVGEYQLTVRDSSQLFTRMLLDAGVVLPSTVREPVNERKPGSYRFEPADDRAFGLIIASAADEFLLIGQNLTIDFAIDGSQVELDHVVEMRVVDGCLVDGRIINGDERLNIVPINRIGAARIRVLKR